MNLMLADHHCSAILQRWYPGAYGGQAVADLLFGHASPSGKLPVTFYQSTQSLPEFTDYRMEGRTYRYIKEIPLYPFGYGLTYGNVICQEVHSCTKPTPGEAMVVEGTFVNTGDIACEDVVQVYVKDMESALAVKHHSLCGFQRISLAPEESCTVKIHIPWNSFLAVDENGGRILDSRHFQIYMGTSQPDSRSVELLSKKPQMLDIYFEDSLMH